MSLEREIEKKESKVLKKIKKFMLKKLTIPLTILAIILIVALGVKSKIYMDNKTVKIGFEDIGEFATQAAYCTETSLIDNSRSLGGISIPFTQSKYIYSYDVVIKAGFNFSEIEWEKNNNVIKVKLPEAKILSSEINLDSFKVYHESESIFNQITMEKSNESLKGLKEKAEKDAVENGLLKNARTNAETLLTGFFSKEYDMDKCEIIFEDK